MEKLWNKLKGGLQDYVKNNGFSDVILGLSGGLDSAVVSVLAAEALGKEKVHCLMMKTRHTSALSLDIAQELADLNGFDYQVLDIEPEMARQTEFLTQAFGEKPAQIVLENLQARERGKILMAYANQYDYLVLACGNKSEAAVGYCTLYGDTCGGLMPVGNIYKTDIFRLAKWRNGLSRVLPEAVIDRSPSAELSAGQKDEDSLPPYAVLDRILKLYVDKGCTAAEITAGGENADTVARVVRLYHRAAFKRRQMADAL